MAGLLRCGHCGRKLHVAYIGENGSSGRYHCRGGSFGGMRIDRAVGAEVIDRLQPPASRLQSVLPAVNPRLSGALAGLIAEYSG